MDVRSIKSAELIAMIRKIKTNHVPSLGLFEGGVRV